VATGGSARARARHLDGVARGHRDTATRPRRRRFLAGEKRKKTLEAGAPCGDAMPPHDTIAGRGQELERVSGADGQSCGCSVHLGFDDEGCLPHLSATPPKLP